MKQLFFSILALVALMPLSRAEAQQTQCAQVQIQIQQELTFERQAFDAEMIITNSLTTLAVEQVDIDVLFEDEFGNPVTATSDPNNTSATFFITVDRMTGITDIDGNGTIAPETEADIHWLIIPTAGAAGNSLTGKLYFVGAAISYELDGEPSTVEVAPDFITVEPQPELELDYFLPIDVRSDNPGTPTIEPPVPFTLGVRIANRGLAPANNTKIDSAQPEIIENTQNLLINFLITGSYVDDTPAQPTLLIDFGDIAAGTSKTGRWIMESSLSGQFVSFNATYSHSPALGGRLTSLIKALRTHLLIRDVRVELPGRDGIKDFLASDGAALKLYESEGIDSLVTDHSASVSLVPNGSTGSVVSYYIDVPPTAGPLYVKVPDPHTGAKSVVSVRRSDGKTIGLDNAWFSVEGTGSQTSYHLHLFDVNGGGRYFIDTDDQAPSGPQPPVLQFIPNTTKDAGERVTFTIRATDPEGVTPILTVDSLPVGATFIDNENGTGTFDWQTTVNQAGYYPVTFRASDGQLSDVQTMYIDLTISGDSDNDGLPDAWEILFFGNLDQGPNDDFDGDGLTNLEEYLLGTDPTLEANAPSIPIIDAPLFGHTVSTNQPTLSVFNSTHGILIPTYEFELYQEEEMLTLLESEDDIQQDPQGVTSFQPTVALAEDSTYFWRSRANLGSIGSEWVYGKFTISETDNQPPLSAEYIPADRETVRTTTPTLSVRNVRDPEGAELAYTFEVEGVVNGTPTIISTSTIPASRKPFTSWQATIPSSAQPPYRWRVRTTDGTTTPVRGRWNRFSVDTSLPPIRQPLPIYPVSGTIMSSPTVWLLAKIPLGINRSTATYEIELSQKADFSQVQRYTGQQTFPLAGRELTNLQENTRYYWRIRGIEGGDTPGSWGYGEFVYDTSNNPPSLPAAINPTEAARVDDLYPLLQVAVAKDPEGDRIEYEYELYDTDQLTNRLDNQTNGLPFWYPTQALGNNSWYYWRYRTKDQRGATSAWSSTQEFYVSVDSTDNPPFLQWTFPAGNITVPSHEDVVLRWDDYDSDSDASISLNANGAVVPLGRKEDLDRVLDRYAFSANTVPPGTYTFGLSIDDGVNPPYLDNSCCAITVLPPDPNRDTDGDGVPNLTDNCQYAYNPNQEDNGGMKTASPDGIGDACQCGDVTGDGRIEDSDLTALVTAIYLGTSGAYQNVAHPELCNLNEDPFCDWDDLVLLYNALLNTAGELPALCEPAIP